MLPESEETISYQIPCFKINGKYVIYFAGYTKHVSVYPIPVDDPKLQETVAPFKHGRGTLQFKLGQPIPYNLIARVSKQHLKERF